MGVVVRDIFEEYLTEDQVANFLGISVKTLRNRVAERRNHPPVIKGLGKFRRDAFERWLKDMEIPQIAKARSA